MTGEPGTPLGYAITALKRELDYNGYGDGLSLAGYTYGVSMESAVKNFQGAHALAVDGVVGPVTSRSLFQKRFGSLEASYQIPDDLVCKTCSLEAAVDPGAVGVADEHDHGIMQINAIAHPEITLDEAFDPKFSLSYYARVLSQGFVKFGDWDCAVAAWNVGGGGASSWCAMGKPKHGGPWWFPSLFQRATEYVGLVRSRPC